MNIIVNGDTREVAEGATVADVVAAHGPEHGRVAVAVNAEVVPRHAWDATALRDDDRVELLAAVQGGSR